MRLSRAACRQAVRVAALKRLFERKAGSPRLFRHEYYAYIAEHEPCAWDRGFEDAKGVSDRKKALEVTGGSGGGSRPSGRIQNAWDTATAGAFNGLAFHHETGSKNPNKPNGYWTTELSKIQP